MRDVLWGAEPPQRVGLDQFLLLLFGDPGLVFLSEDRLWGDAIGPNAVGADLGREVLGEQLDTCLRRPVGHERVGTGPAAGCG